MIPYSLNPLGIDSQLSDLDILRQIRDANPTSQLPGLWLDSEDPYTQWEGVAWNGEKVTVLSPDRELWDIGITTLEGVNNLRSLNKLNIHGHTLSNVNVSDMPMLTYLSLSRGLLTSIELTGTLNLIQFDCDRNKLTAILSLTEKGAITQAKFNNNLMPTTETDRLLAMGFTSAQVLPQDI